MTLKIVCLKFYLATKSDQLEMRYLAFRDYNNLHFLLPKVRMEDQVTFASEKTEGQYIHTSGRTYRHVGIALHENKLEFINQWINFSVVMFLPAMKSMLLLLSQGTLLSLIIVQCPMNKSR